MAKPPHTPEFRAKVSQEYLDGLGSYLFYQVNIILGLKHYNLGLQSINFMVY